MRESALHISVEEDLAIERNFSVILTGLMLLLRGICNLNLAFDLEVEVM